MRRKWKVEKDKKRRQQSNLSVLNVGRGSVKHAIYVFVLPVSLFHKSMLVVFSYSPSIIERWLINSSLSVVGAACEADYSYLLFA